MATLAINIEPLAAAPTVTVSPPSNAANRLTVSVKRIGPPQNPPDKPLRSILARKINGHSPTRPDGTVIMADDLNDTELFMEFGPLECFTDNANNDSIVYALHTFVATLDGQICVLKGDILTLLDDSNSYWWLVRCVKTLEVGYIPAENIEVSPICTNT